MEKEGWEAGRKGGKEEGRKGGRSKTRRKDQGGLGEEVGSRGVSGRELGEGKRCEGARDYMCVGVSSSWRGGPRGEWGRKFPESRIKDGSVREGGGAGEGQDEDARLCKGRSRDGGREGEGGEREGGR
eukprot:1643945-Rhodomonas_salina.1